MGASHRGAVSYGVEDWAVREAGRQTGKLGQSRKSYLKIDERETTVNDKREK